MGATAARGSILITGPVRAALVLEELVEDRQDLDRVQVRHVLVGEARWLLDDLDRTATDAHGMDPLGFGVG